MLKRLFWGSFFILAAALTIINALGLYTSINIVSLLFTILMTAIIIKSLVHFNFGGILIPLAIIGIIFAEPLEITNITPWPLLITAFLLSAGLEIMFGRTQRIIKAKIIGGNFHSRFENNENFGEIVDEEDESVVTYSVNFGSGMKYVNSAKLKKAYLSCKFGALKVYFDNAVLDSEGAEIILDVAFGGTELYIPKEWNVIIGTNATLGAIEEKNRKMQTDGPKITIKGNVSLSGVEIIYI